MIEFEGRRYYEDKQTGYCKTAVNRGDREYLHRAVYSKEYGNIPHGWHVHHKDDDRANNEIDNLVAMPMRDHVHGVHKRMFTGTCDGCGEEYTKRAHGTNRWCSAQCAWTWHNKRRYA